MAGSADASWSEDSVVDESVSAETRGETGLALAERLRESARAIERARARVRDGRRMPAAMSVSDLWIRLRTRFSRRDN